MAIKITRPRNRVGGANMTKPYLKIITVRGSYRFPLDMLRYDCAYPRTETDSGKMWQTIDNPMLPSQEIELLSWNMPNPDRWRSFMWEVVRVEVAHGRRG